MTQAGATVRPSATPAERKIHDAKYQLMLDEVAAQRHRRAVMDEAAPA